MGTLRIFLACADESLRLALLMLLDQEPGMILAGVADRFTRITTQLEGAQPDVMLLYWDQTIDQMIALFDQLKNLEEQPKVIVLSANPQIKQAALKSGAYSFVSSDAPPDMLLPILNDLMISKTKK